MTTFILLHGGQNLVFMELMTPNLRLLIQNRLNLHLVEIFFNFPSFQLSIVHFYLLATGFKNLHVHQRNTYSYELFNLSQITNHLVTLMSFLTHNLLLSYTTCDEMIKISLQG